MKPAAASLLVAALLAAGCHPKPGPRPPEVVELDMRVFQACQLALDDGLTVAQAAQARGLPDAAGKAPAVYGDVHRHAVVMPTRDGQCLMAWAKGASPANREMLLKAFGQWVGGVQPVKASHGEAWCGRATSPGSTRIMVVRPVDRDLLVTLADADEDCVARPATALSPPLGEGSPSGDGPTTRT